MTSYCRERLEFTAHQRPTVGDTKMSVIPNDHLGWLKCDGRFMSKDEFYLLFRVIGYSFTASPGGDTFQLPNAAGRVPGVIGTGTDANLSTFSIALGDSIGEYNHTLTIAEMPSHNHGVAGGGQGPTNNLTNVEGAHSHTINDPGHIHTQTTINDDFNNSGNYSDLQRPSYPNSDTSGTVTWTGTINNATTGISINTNGAHAHTLNPAGGSNAHNNIQPTIGLGNMFIYSGRTFYPLNGFPYTDGTLIL